jgi:hypothetical protein
MNTKLDGIELWFIRLKLDIESKDSLKIENTIDWFWNTTMSFCLDYFWKDSELYKDAQKIYGEIVVGLETKNNSKIEWVLPLIDKLLTEIKKLILSREE